MTREDFIFELMTLEKKDLVQSIEFDFDSKTINFTVNSKEYIIIEQQHYDNQKITNIIDSENTYKELYSEILYSDKKYKIFNIGYHQLKAMSESYFSGTKEHDFELLPLYTRDAYGNEELLELEYKEFIKSDKNILALTSEFGYGKSTSISKLSLESKKILIPCKIDGRDKYKIFDKIIEKNELCKLHDKDFILVFDDLDETSLEQHSSLPEIINKIIDDLSEAIEKSKIIFSIRRPRYPHIHTNIKQIFINFSSLYKILNIQKIKKDELRSILISHNYDIDDYSDTLYDYLSVPIVLGMYMNLHRTSISSQEDNTLVEKMSFIEFYDYLIKATVTRKSLLTTFKEDKIFKLLSEVAFKIADKDFLISYRTIRTIYHKIINKEEAASYGFDRFIKKCTFLETMPQFLNETYYSYRFKHKSFHEYFLAYHQVQVLKNLFETNSNAELKIGLFHGLELVFLKTLTHKLIDVEIIIEHIKQRDFSNLSDVNKKNFIFLVYLIEDEFPFSEFEYSKEITNYYYSYLKSIYQLGNWEYDEKIRLQFKIVLFQYLIITHQEDTLENYYYWLEVYLKIIQKEKNNDTITERNLYEAKEKSYQDVLIERIESKHLRATMLISYVRLEENYKDKNQLFQYYSLLSQEEKDIHAALKKGYE